MGRSLEILQLALRNLLRNKLRSLLTMLGMIFGVGSVITMLSVGSGARHEILSRIAELGICNVIVNSIAPPEDIRPETEESYKNEYGLKFKDVERIKLTCPSVERILQVNKVKERVWFRSRRLDAAILGVEPEYLEMFNLTVGRGRRFQEIDSQRFAKVCVIRKGLLSQIESVEDAIGLNIRLGGNTFEVIGVLEDEAFRSHTRKALALDGRAQEVYIPYTTSMRVFGTVTFVQRSGSQEFTEVELDQAVVVASAPEKVLSTSKMISAILEREHEKRDYEIVVPLELLEQQAETQRVFQTVMVLIASISLLVGGIGIANIMLATITERTREIGVRRALGARRRDIGVQFLVETTTIAAIGGIIGCLIGFAGVQGIVHYTEWQALIAPEYLLISLGISCVVGILSGIWPARRAAHMDPITALHYE
jgi:putative ABC transport system permease protein